MAKVNPTRKIQKPRTEEEMRSALKAFCEKKQTMCIPPQDDDDDIILLDCIEELLEARKTLEEVRAFAQTWTAKTNRR